MTLDAVHWTIDGRPSRVRGWRATTAINKGFDLFSGDIPASEVNKRSASYIQDAPVVGFDRGSKIIWEGRLVADPYVLNEVAQVAAEGHGGVLERTHQRILLQTRDTSAFADETGAPFNYAGSAGIDVQSSDGGGLHFRASANEGGERGMALWARGAQISRVAFTFSGPGNIKLYTAAGPSGTKTLIGTYAAGATDVSFAAADMIVVALSIGGSAGEKDALVSLMRVNGLDVSGDSLFAAKAAKVIFKRAHFDATVSQFARGPNVLPLDFADTSLAEALTKLAELCDARWGVWETAGSAPRAEFGGWDRTWTAIADVESQVDLQPMTRYNRVVVRYQTIAKQPAQVTVKASPDPLQRYGTERTYEISLDDPQPDDTLAKAFGALIVARLSQKRYQGRARIAGVRESSSVYDVRAGDLIRLANFGPSDVLHRITETEMTADGVTAGISAELSAASMLARLTGRATV